MPTEAGKPIHGTRRWPGLALVAALALLTVAPVHADADAMALGFARQVQRSGDARGHAFSIVDKPSATLWVFNIHGQPVAKSHVIVGEAAGDETPADIGSRPLRQIKPHEKVTNAGRYLTESGVNAAGEDIVWLDYDGALSMHRVRNVPGEQRLTRIESDDPARRRISYGCVNVPASFYDRHIKPWFADRAGVVYVLPEHKAVGEVFPFADQR